MSYFACQQATVSFADEASLPTLQAWTLWVSQGPQGFVHPQIPFCSKQAAHPGVAAGALSEERE